MVQSSKTAGAEGIEKRRNFFGPQENPQKTEIFKLAKNVPFITPPPRYSLPGLVFMIAFE